MPTPHNNAKKGDFAKTVLMPGDPLRAKYIAETFLENAVLVNNVRGVQGYTGYYKGKRVSVMASGMGMPSMGIYSHELFELYDVDNIIRVGSAGAISKDLKVYDIVFAQSACTDSNYAFQFGIRGTISPIASYDLLERAVKIAREENIPFTVGNILSSDHYYDDSNSTLVWDKLGVLAVEMETTALYLNAMRSGKRALTILTISDSLVTGEKTTAEERERSFETMMRLALEVAL